MGEPLRLYGLNALITSGGSGIGEATARTLVKHGANVLAVDTANSGVDQTYRSVKGINGHVSSLTDAGQLKSVVDDAVKKLGGIDILVNEFPFSLEAPLSNDDSRLEKLLGTRTDLISSISKAALPHLKKSPAGRIINIGFLRSVFAADAGDAYDRAEQDLAELTRSQGASIGEFGITATYVQPGAVMTPVSREVFRKNKELRDYCIAHSAAQRLGEPVDIAKVVLFLASDDSAFVSGTGIRVDGGPGG